MKYKLENNVNVIRNKSGIYIIKSFLTGRVYVGQSINMLNRKNAHIKKLRKNSHDNNHLQNIYNKYGEEDLTFFFIENCLKEDLSKKEEYWCNMFDKSSLINQAPVGSSIKISEETREKFRLLGLIRGGPMAGRKHSEETKRLMSENRKGHPPWNRGKKHSEETKKKISEFLRQRPVKESTREKMSNSMKKYSRENRAKLNIHQVLEVKNNPHISTKEFSQRFLVSKRTIADIRNHKTWKDIV